MQAKQQPIRRWGWFFAYTLLAFFTFAVLLARTAAAQDYRAKVTVEVKDASGALIPAASLTLTRVSTKTETPAKTDEAGAYVFQLLEPDTYTLDVSAPGMAPAQINNIVLVAYAATSIPVTLRVGSQTAEVTVKEQPALLETESASRAFSIEQQEVQDLPVINGNPVMLGETIPGVFMRPLGVYTDPWTVTSQFQINGGLMSLNEFLIDGSPNDSEFGLNTYAYTLPQFAVKEFTVSANNYDAQYGHTSGGAINMTTASGSSQYKGLFWSSFRRTDWNANTSQNKYLNAINQSNFTTPFNSQTQLGFQVGGPMFIPKLMHSSGKYKPFFFFAFDHYSELLPRSLILSYPTARMRSGDFSELLNPTNGYGNSIMIADPSTTHLDTTAGSPTFNHYIRNPFPNNIIPASRINPVAAKIAALLPAVGSTPTGQRPGTSNLSIPNNYYDWHFHNVAGRFDFNIGEKYKLFLRPFNADFSEVSNAGGVNGPGANGGTFHRTSKGYLVDFVDVMNPKTVINARFGYAFFRVKWTSPNNENFDLTSLGYPSSLNTQQQSPNFFGQYAFQNYSPLGWFHNVEDTGTYSWEGNLSRQLGAHNLRLGWDVRLVHFSFINPGNFAFTANSDWTTADYTNTNSIGTSGDSFATFLLGTPSSGSTPINSVYQVSSWYTAPYLQDDWRVNNKLTLNIGLRWDLLTAPIDKKDRLDVGFDPTMPSALQGQIPSSVTASFPAASNLTGGLMFANVNGAPRAPIQNAYHNFQPRFGFAYAATDRLVVRGGYGLFYTNFQNNSEIQNLGFGQSTPLNVSNDGGLTPIPNVLSNPFPNGIIQPSGSSLGSLTSIGQTGGITVFNRNFKVPSAHEFSLGFQYRVTKASVFEAAYVGNRGRGFAVSEDVNQAPWSFLQKCDEVYASGSNNACTAQQANPFKGIAAFSGTPYYTNSTLQARELARPHPQFSTVTLAALNRGYSWYNGMQLSYNYRMSHGVSFNTSYVWSKMIYQTGWMSQALNIPQRSVYQFGIPKVFKVSGLFQLPFGRNRLVNFRGNRIIDGVIGGWDFSPSLQTQSGEPATLPTNAIMLPHNRFTKPDWSNYTRAQAWGTCVANKTPVTGVLVPTNASINRGCGTDTGNYDWAIVTTQVNEQANPTYSNTVRMKPVIMSDAAVQKSFTIHDRYVATMRLSASNVLNHFNLETAKFVIDPTNANFGTINQGTTPTTDSPPRNVNVQFRVAF